MSLPVAALGAVVAALLELSIVPYLRIGGAQPDLVLVLAVAWTIVVGIEGGLVWAFLGGLAPRPLGSTAFILLLCIGGAAILGRVLEPVRLAAPVIITFVVAICYAVLFLVVYGALRTPIPVPDPIGAVLPRAIYDTVLAALIGSTALWWLARRRAEGERVDW
jgi:rod shape-determining protein MreD